MQSFRNYGHVSLTIDEPRLLLLGPNGAGKSNLLEAVELMGTLRSHRCSSDGELIGHGQRWARLVGLTDADERLELVLRRRGGRQVRRNDRVLNRQSDLLGHLRCVSFSAMDLDLIRGEPGRRRHWVDGVVLQLEPAYADLLQRQRRLLRQRRRVWQLPMPAADRESLLDALDHQMAMVGGRIRRRRERALSRLDPCLKRWHARLSGALGSLDLHYRTGGDAGSEREEEGPGQPSPREAPDSWEERLLEQLKRQRSLESRLGSPQAGPHRDEISFLLAGRSARRYGSAGQQRTLVLALKLAELELIEAVCGAPPVLVLDDVLAELDLQRQSWLLETAGNGHQCLISATHLAGFDPQWRRQSQLVQVEQGGLRPMGVADVV
ncbi:DNA replication/repair protein RecF [Synechococcus sp. RSCCF101]|uniref:DNA replication/repair protein RecF n=1 Tax=Synechococcus sp. RSCCF101 TaxID=2511069 RepID=UPI00351A724F